MKTAFKILFAGIFLLDDYSHHSHHSGGQLLERMGFLRRQPWAVATLYSASSLSRSGWPTKKTRSGRVCCGWR